MQSSYLRITFILFLITFSACKKDTASLSTALNSTKQTNQSAIDTTVAAKEVQVSEKDHRIMIRPKPNTVQHYRITTHTQITASADDPLAQTGVKKISGTNHSEMFITQTVKSIRPDSSIDFTYRIDSLVMQAQQDTARTSYSSGRASDRKDPRFQQFNVILGQEFGAIVTRQGDITEIYGITNSVNQLMKSLPDSMQRNEQYKNMANQQVQGMLNHYLQYIIVHLPAKPLAKDSSWGDNADINFPVDQFVQFPVRVNSKEVLKGFEERQGNTVAVFEANTTTTPVKTTLTGGPITATLKNFTATEHVKTMVDDATGLLLERKAHVKKTYQYSLESKQQPGKVSTRSQDGTDDTTIDLLQ